MSKRERLEPSMIPGQETGEKFMAILLWAQKGTCNCAACQYLREMGGGMIQRHVKEAPPHG